MFRSLRHQNHLSFTSRMYSTKLLSSASSSTKKKITLPEINDEKLSAAVLEYAKMNSIDKNNKNFKFYCFYGDRAYNYYSARALNLKFPNATREEFMKIANVLITRKFLAEIAKVCRLDMIISKSNSKLVIGNLGERMEAYCSGMLFNGMEEELKKFASDIVDYYFSKQENEVIIKKVNNQAAIKESEVAKENILNKAVGEAGKNNKEEKPKEIDPKKGKKGAAKENVINKAIEGAEKNNKEKLKKIDSKIDKITNKAVEKVEKNSEEEKLKEINLKKDKKGDAMENINNKKNKEEATMKNIINKAIEEAEKNNIEKLKKIDSKIDKITNKAVEKVEKNNKEEKLKEINLKKDKKGDAMENINNKKNKEEATMKNIINKAIEEAEKNNIEKLKKIDPKIDKITNKAVEKVEKNNKEEKLKEINLKKDKKGDAMENINNKKNKEGATMKNIINKAIEEAEKNNIEKLKKIDSKIDKITNKVVEKVEKDSKDKERIRELIKNLLSGYQDMSNAKKEKFTDRRLDILLDMLYDYYKRK